jgi:hypothetical protein
MKSQNYFCVGVKRILCCGNGFCCAVQNLTLSHLLSEHMKIKEFHNYLSITGTFIC